MITDFPITCLRWKPFNRTTLLVVSADGSIHQIHSSTGKTLLKMHEKSNPIMCCDYSNDGFLFVTGGNDKKVRLYDDNTKTLISLLESKQYNLPEHSNRIFATKFHPMDSNVLVSGGWDNNILIYDIRTKAVQGSFYGPHICGDSMDIKGNTLLTASWEKKDQIQLFDLRMRKQMSVVQCYHNEQGDKNGNTNFTYLYSCRFHPKQNVFAITGSNKNLMRVYKYKDINTITNDNIEMECESKELDLPCYSVDFSYDGRLMAYGNADSMVRVVELRDNKK
jgi:WD40 repeat protein